MQIWEYLTKFSGAFIRTVLHTKHSGTILAFFHTKLSGADVDTFIRNFQEQAWIFSYESFRTNDNFFIGKIQEKM